MSATPAPAVTAEAVRRPGVGRAWRTVSLGMAAGVVTFAVMNRAAQRPPRVPLVPEPVRDLSPPAVPDPRLDRVLDAVDFDAVPLADAVGRLAAAADLVAKVDWGQITSDGKPRAMTVTVHLRRAAVPDAITSVLTAAAEGTPLGWTDRAGTVTVTSAEASEAADVVTRAYDVRPLLRDLADRRADFGPDPTVLGCFPVPGTDAITPEQACIDAVKSLVMHVEANSWKENGGEVGSIEAFDGWLVVTQTRRAHAAIEPLLAHFYRTR